MSEAIRPFAEWCAIFLEGVGIVIITALAVYALAIGAVGLIKSNNDASVYQTVRQRLGHGILLGLEFLVAADIIHTVAVELTFRTVGVLAAIVLIRTFLSFTLEVELTGNWPWHQDQSAD